jgi:hypothetical protein
MTWPGGTGTSLHLEGRCRDFRTPAQGAPTTVANVHLQAVTGDKRDIESIVAEPSVAGLQNLIGCKGGGSLRAAIRRELPDEVERGTPAHLLLDDLAGSTLIAGFAYFPWADHMPEFAERRQNAPRRVMQGICSGFRPGASSLREDGTQSGVAHNVARVTPLNAKEDPVGWHPLDDHPPVAMRRARRIDVWSEGDQVGIDAMFRDSCWDPEGIEVAVHEYQLTATAERGTGVLRRSWPGLECCRTPSAHWPRPTPSVW